MTNALDDLQVLARTIYGEARGESDEGKQGVANVILNRFKAQSRFGKTIKEVCLKPFQFSCWNANDPNRPKLLNVTEADAVYAECLAVANNAIAGNLPDNTAGARFYKVTGTPASWAKGHTPCCVIGHHEFYNDVL